LPIPAPARRSTTGISSATAFGWCSAAQAWRRLIIASVYALAGNTGPLNYGSF